MSNALKNGKIRAEDVPIDYIVRDGNTLILNTRSSQALKKAGIKVVNSPADIGITMKKALDAKAKKH